MKQLVLFFLLCATHCFAQNKSTAAKFLKIKEIIHAQPEEAKALIKAILHSANLNDTIRSDAYKYYGIYHNIKGNTDSSLYYYNIGLKYAAGDAERSIQGSLNIANLYLKTQELENADNQIKKALALSSKNNDILLGRIYSMRGSVYNAMLKEEEAVVYLTKAVEILRREKDSVILAAALSNLAGTYMHNENYDFAIDIYNETLQGFKKNNHLHNYYITLINYADCHIYIKKPAIAVKALNESIAWLKQIGNEPMLANALWKLGKAEFMLNHFDKSVNAYEEAQLLAIKHNSSRSVVITAEYLKVLLQNKLLGSAGMVIKRIENSSSKDVANLEDKIFYEQQKAFYFESTNQSKEAVGALKTVFHLQDSLRASTKANETRALQAKFQNELQREKNNALVSHNRQLKENQNIKNKLFWLTVCLFVISVVGASIFIALLRSRNKLSKERLRRAEADSKLIGQEHQNELRQNKLLQMDLEAKDSELVISRNLISDFLVDIDEKNQLIRKINEEMVLLKDNNAAEDLINQQQLRLNDVLSKAIVTEEKWNTFLTLFKEVYPDYHSQIMQKLPGLSPAELRYITLRKLNLSPREIAGVLGVLPDAIRLYKHRLRKKYGFSTDDELDAIIM